MYIYYIFIICNNITCNIITIYIGIWSINSKIHSKITENNDAKIVDFSEDRGYFTGNFTGQITNNIEIILKIYSKIKENDNENNKDVNDFTNKNFGNFNDGIKIKRNNNKIFNKNNNKNFNVIPTILDINNDKEIKVNFITDF